MLLASAGALAALILAVEAQVVRAAMAVMVLFSSGSTHDYCE
jgi:hypothetical protein